MSVPTQVEALSLHERLLQGGPVASQEVFEVFMDPILRALTRFSGCTREEAWDPAIDAVMSYLQDPSRYDPSRASLLTYLTRAARNRLIDGQRSMGATKRREQEFAIVFELLARSPYVAMEISMEARDVVRRLEHSGLGEAERALLGLILQGERSTRRMAEALGLGHLPELELRREVKRRRDRLMKWLERFGREEPHVES
jgi:RNA polymerase sigma-70 factor (ECF subfamily)